MDDQIKFEDDEFVAGIIKGLKKVHNMINDEDNYTALEGVGIMREIMEILKMDKEIEELQEAALKAYEIRFKAKNE